MSKKTKSRKPIIAVISDERCDQLMNDAAEDIRSGTVEEWRAVAQHLSCDLDRLFQSQARIRPSIAAATTAQKIIQHARQMHNHAICELNSWLDTQTPSDP